MELEGIPSIWDGWEKQCFGVGRRDDDSCCAIYFLLSALHTKDVARRVVALGRHIQATTDLPLVFDTIFTPRTVPEHALIYANDVLRWTPEQFRAIDKQLEYEEGMRQIEQQIEEVRHDVSEVSA